MRKRSIIKLYRSKKQKSKGKYEEVDWYVKIDTQFGEVRLVYCQSNWPF
jgi:hypothetical protein